MNIRDATKEVLPQILALFAQPDMDGEGGLTITEAEKTFERIRSHPEHFTYVIVDEGQICGTFSLLVIQMLSHSGGRVGIIEDVVVKSDSQGQGYGQAMMKFAAKRSQELGCYKIMLSSGLHRERAHKFYEEFGFARHGYSFLLEDFSRWGV